MPFTPGYAKILQSDYTTFDNEALEEFQNIYPNNTATQYCAAIDDVSPTYCWVRIEHQSVYELPSLAPIILGQSLRDLQDAVAEGMQVEPEPE